MAHLHLCSDNPPPPSSYCTHMHKPHVNISGILFVLLSRATALISVADSLLKSLKKNHQTNLIKDDPTTDEWHALNLGNNQVALQSQTSSYENEPPWINQNVSCSTLCSKCCRQTDNPPSMPCKNIAHLIEKWIQKRNILNIRNNHSVKPWSLPLAKGGWGFVMSTKNIQISLHSNFSVSGNALKLLAEQLPGKSDQLSHIQEDH